jgi:hypothetical protein
MKPHDIKEALSEKGLVQDDLFAWGIGTVPYGIWDAALTIVTLPLILGGGMPYTGDREEKVAFTLVDGELIITPTRSTTVIFDRAIRIKRTDVNKVSFKTNSKRSGTLHIERNDGKTSQYRVKTLSAMNEIVEKFNSL